MTDTAGITAEPPCFTFTVPDPPFPIGVGCPLPSDLTSLDLREFLSDRDDRAASPVADANVVIHGQAGHDSLGEVGGFFGGLGGLGEPPDDRPRLNTLVGGPGNDILNGGAGADLIAPGRGEDHIYFSGEERQRNYPDVVKARSLGTDYIRCFLRDDLDRLVVDQLDWVDRCSASATRRDRPAFALPQ